MGRKILNPNKDWRAEIKPIPWEETPGYFLQQHHGELVRMEAAIIEAEQQARESVKDFVIGGPADRTNWK